MPGTESESAVKYRDDEDRVRVIRGVVSFDNGFVVVTRRDGQIMLPRERIVWIEQWHGEERP